MAVHHGHAERLVDAMAAEKFKELLVNDFIAVNIFKIFTRMAQFRKSVIILNRVALNGEQFCGGGVPKRSLER